MPNQQIDVPSMPGVLEPRQLVRVEAVHRGFLYQHLYGAACLLRAGVHGISSVSVELDEDIELHLQDGERLYVQVKTRSTSLIFSDIASALERFGELRFAHANGQRAGSAKFAVVTNAPLGLELQGRLMRTDWPLDVLILTPDNPDARPACLPPSWPHLSAAADWCVAEAANIPMGTLEPETLVWKLAGRVMLAATGQGSGHEFSTGSLPELFEQLVVQLQRFPALPEVYRPLDDEPPLDTPARVRIVTGHSGAGKTAWAAQAAQYLGVSCAYYDVGDLPGPAVAASLVRELAAQWIGASGKGLRHVLLPGPSGLDPLRALDVFLAERNLPALVVLDNAHRVPAEDMRAIIDATRHLRLVFLAQPNTSIATLEIIAGVSQEPLHGWGLDQVAGEVGAHRARASAPTLGKLLALTGGLPLYVRNAAQLAAAQYEGNVAALCQAIEAQIHLTETAQEVVLRKSFDCLPESARLSAAVLSLSDVPLSVGEVSDLASAAFDLSPTLVAGAMRSLKPLGIVRVDGSRRMQLHDAFRVIARRILDDDASRARVARETLRDLLLKSFASDRDVSRVPPFVKVLVELQHLAPLLDIATEEFFHELGIDGGIWEMLKRAADDESIAPEQRFHALDALVFADFKADADDNIEARLDAMERLASEHSLGERATLVVLLKRMLYSAGNGDRASTDRAIASAEKLAPDSPDHQRIVSYNIAHARFHLGDWRLAETMARALVDDYYEHLGINPRQVIGADQASILAALNRSASLSDDLKHLADSLDLLAKAKNKQGLDSGFARVHAMKFYSLAHALTSLIAVGQDLVDEFVGRGEYQGACEVIEQHILPVAVRYKMLDHLVSIRSQYAVVLAYSGRFKEAEAVLTQLDVYDPGLSAQQQTEIANQRKLIARLRERPVVPMASDPRTVTAAPRKIGRNAMCPCGSGNKFKRCHGAPGRR